MQNLTIEFVDESGTGIALAAKKIATSYAKKRDIEDINFEVSGTRINNAEKRNFGYNSNQILPHTDNRVILTMTLPDLESALGIYKNISHKPDIFLLGELAINDSFEELRIEDINKPGFNTKVTNYVKKAVNYVSFVYK